MKLQVTFTPAGALDRGLPLTLRNPTDEAFGKLPAANRTTEFDVQYWEVGRVYLILQHRDGTTEHIAHSEITNIKH